MDQSNLLFERSLFLFVGPKGDQNKNGMLLMGRSENSNCSTMNGHSVGDAPLRRSDHSCVFKLKADNSYHFNFWQIICWSCSCSHAPLTARAYMEKIPPLCRVFHSSSAIKLTPLSYEKFPNSKIFPTLWENRSPMYLLEFFTVVRSNHNSCLQYRIINYIEISFS